MTFSDLVETVKDLSIDEKEELQMLLKQYLREERREEIYENFSNYSGRRLGKSGVSMKTSLRACRT